MTIQEAEDILVEAPLTSNERRAVNALRNRIKALETLIDGAASGFDAPGAPPYVKEGVRFLREGLGEEYAKKNP